MESTENSGEKLWISPQLLDELIREYQVASGQFYSSQVNLLSNDPQTIITNLQRANGAGHMLKVIMSKIPKEVINDCPIRSYIWNALFGTFAGGTSEEGRRRKPSQDPGQQAGGKKGTGSIWSRKSGNKSNKNRP